MRVRYAISIFLFAGLCCSAQQQSSNPQSGQTSTQTPTQDTQQTETKSQGKKLSPAEANPFPEAVSRAAAEKANPAASGTKSAPADYSSSRVNLKLLDAPDGSESRISNGAGGYIHDPELAAQDDKVGSFYFQNGDFKGAYDRYKEATRVAPEDGTAVFGLAESARGLHLTQEAVTNYTLYLDAFPDGKKAKEARKALAALDSSHKK